MRTSPPQGFTHDEIARDVQKRHQPGKKGLKGWAAALLVILIVVIFVFFWGLSPNQ